MKVQEHYPTNIVLRNPQLADAPWVHRLRGENWREIYGTPYNRGWLEGQIAQLAVEEYERRIELSLDSESGLFMQVAYDATDGQVLGYMESRKDSIGFGGRAYPRELRALHVADGARGQGVGTVLCECFNAWAGDELDHYVEVADGTRPIGFYKRQGFKHEAYRYQWGPPRIGIGMVALLRPGVSPELAQRRKARSTA